MVDGPSIRNQSSDRECARADRDNADEDFQSHQQPNRADNDQGGASRQPARESARVVHGPTSLLKRVAVHYCNLSSTVRTARVSSALARMNESAGAERAHAATTLLSVAAERSDMRIFRGRVVHHRRVTDDSTKQVFGVVRFWREDKGWGAISSPDLPEGRDAWVHFSAIGAVGYRALTAGQRVEFSYRQQQQDSFSLLADWVKALD